MAIKITEECINCGACEPECPNTAIFEGGAEWSFAGKTYGEGDAAPSGAIGFFSLIRSNGLAERRTRFWASAGLVFSHKGLGIIPNIAPPSSPKYPVFID